MPGNTLPPTEHSPAPEMEAALARTQEFLGDVAPHLGRLYGIDLNISVGDGWATNLETGDVTADPRFFLEKGYSADESSYAVLHEVAAHLREVIMDPGLTNRVIQFKSQGKAASLFHNILGDIAGNNLNHAMLPRTKDTAEGLYSEKLFPDALVDEETGEQQTYDQLPRHLQFLYKIIREEMIPGSETPVFPEVQAALDSLRDYQGQGDLIKYSTSVAKSTYEAMSPRERFDMWKGIIYPVFTELLEQDRQDPNFQNQEGDSGDGQGEGQPSDGEPEGEPSKGDPSAASDGKKFSKYYEDYDKNRHPEPMSEEDHKKLHDHAKEAAREKRHPKDNPQQELDKKIREETGHSLYEQRRYNAEVSTFQDEIAKMRDVYQQIINDRVTVKRGLSRRPTPEGVILDPDRLTQTVIDMQSGVTEPDAFRDYETKRGEAQSVGKTDYFFVFDVSGSMAGEKAKAAASSAVIGLEGLSALQRDIEEAEAQYNMDLELDIRTAIYTFGADSKCVKPLSTQVTPKQRLDTYAAVRNANDSSTSDFLALEEIDRLPKDSDRRQIVIVMTDGESDNSPRARRSIDSIRGKGGFVYGIGIGSDEAKALYQPTSRRVDDPTKLPETIATFIEATIS